MPCASSTPSGWAVGAAAAAAVAELLDDPQTAAAAAGHWCQACTDQASCACPLKQNHQLCFATNAIPC